MIASGAIPEAALRPPIAAVSVGMLEGTAVLDLNYAEDSLADVDLNVVMTHDGRFIEVQGTAEGEPFAQDDLDTMLSLAKKGIAEINIRQKQLLDSLR